MTAGLASPPPGEERQLDGGVGRRDPALEHDAAVAANLKTVAVGTRGTRVCEELAVRTVSIDEFL